MSKAKLKNMNKMYEYKGFEIELIFTGLWGYKVYNEEGNSFGDVVGGFTGEDYALKYAENYIDRLDKRNKGNNFTRTRNVVNDINEDLGEALEKFENEQEMGAITVNSVSHLLKQIGYKVLYLNN